MVLAGAVASCGLTLNRGEETSRAPEKQCTLPEVSRGDAKLDICLKEGGGPCAGAELCCLYVDYGAACIEITARYECSGEFVSRHTECVPKPEATFEEKSERYGL